MDATHSKQNLPALMGLRFVLSLWVLGMHLGPVLTAFFALSGWPLMLLQKGSYAVDLFFILSGIVITHHYGDRLWKLPARDYASFLWLRLARIYPLHLVTLCGVVVLVSGAYWLGYGINRPSDYTAQRLIENIFLVQAWHLPNHVSWNHFAWSISAEWFAYLTAPLVFFLIYTFTALRARIALCLGFLTLMPVLYALIVFEGNSAYALPRVIGAFGAGVCLYKISTQFQPSKWLFRGGLVMWIAFMLVEALAPCRLNYVALYPACLWIVCLIQTGSAQRFSFGRLLSHQTLQYLGNLAYALYITQFVVLMPVKKLLPAEDYMDASIVFKTLYIAGIVALLGVTTLMTHHVIEQPARDFLRRRNPFATLKR